MQSYIIDDREKLVEFISMVESNYNDIDIVAFDLETDSVEEVKANLYGIGIAFQEDEGFYFPIRTPEGELFFKEATDSVMSIVQKILKDKRIIGHNIIYDTLVWKKNTGVDISNSIYADTILMKHCINEEPPFGLKEVAVTYLGEWADMAKEELLANIKANGGTTTKDNMQMFKADTAVLGKYCTWDVMLTYKLFNLFSGMLKEEQLEDFFYKEEVMPLYKEVTIRMKERGFPVDVEYFRQLNKEISIDIDNLELKVMEQLEETVYDFMAELLNEKSPVKKTGSYPKAYAKLIGLELDSIAKKKVEAIDPKNEVQLNFKQWMLSEVELSGPVVQAQLKLYFDKFPDQNYVFNLRSKAHLKRLFFEILGEKELSTTDSGEPQVDDAFLESMSSKYKWVAPLQDLNKLEKIKGTYIEGILDRQVSGIVYASLLQFGTTSGRYASRNPNLQNLPRSKEDDSGLSELVLHYNNAIRKGFIAPTGYKIVSADYSALEPRCFSVVSGDANLQRIFHSGEDMYSAIAKRIFNLKDVSTFKKDPNFLGKLHPEKRQVVKAMALAVTYGAEAFRIGDLLGVDRDEAQRLIDMYLESYPGLKKYIQKCHYEANNYGVVKTMFGRVRHLSDAKRIYNEYGYNILDSRWAKRNGLGDERRLYKNKLNNSTNFKIQGLASHIVNKAAIKITRAFSKTNIDGYIALQIHDEIVCIVKDNQAEEALGLVKKCMETVVELPVPLIAEPKIASNMKDAK